MADLDEDAPTPPPHSSTPPDPQDHDLSDETQDFRFLTHLTHLPSLSSASTPTTLPRRGEKDFEPHGTAHQDRILAASREAMHTALSYPRLHAAKSHVVGELDAASGMTVVARAKGQHFRTMGRADREGRVWLRPEEAVYLCERGNLDVRWPGVVGEGEGEGLPMSLQGVYACLMGRGGLSLERYVVYAGLKRGGYVVLRAPTWGDGGGDEGDDGEAEVEGRSGGVEREKGQRYWGWGWGLFARVFRSLVSSKAKAPPPLGPLVTPGLYRSYSEPWCLLCQLVLTMVSCRRHISPALHHPVS